MFRRALGTFSEMLLWFLLLLIFLTGCTRTETTAQPVSPESAPPAAGPGSDAMQDIPLIPRDVLFGNPRRARARISPDGQWLSYSAPVDGVLNVWVAPVDDIDAAVPVTDSRVRPVPGYFWAYTSKHIIYTQDKNGDENMHVYVTDVETRETRDLTPLDGVRASIYGVSEKFPEEILVGLNDRDPRLHDVWRYNILTGERELIQENHGVASYVPDDDYRIRMAVNYAPDGGQEWLVPEGEGIDRTWDVFARIDAKDGMTTSPLGFDKTGERLFYTDSRDRNTAALFSMDLATGGEVTLLAEDPRCDVGGIMAHPTEKNVQAVSFTYARQEWRVLDDAIAADMEYLKTVEDGELLVTSRTLDDTQWTVAYVLDDGPIKFYHYVRGPERKATYLFSSRDDLEAYPLVKMHDEVVKSRDGLDLVCYLSLPPGSDPDGDGRPTEPVPMVLDVHGGPWSRDGWGFNSYHQWLTNRGYAVLNVNFRGSTGFGKEFTNAANGEWAGKMHDDLLDAVDWAVEQGIAPRDEIAIMGGSYGGYATLVGLTFTPEVFACGVDIVGPSSLVTLLDNMPEYWKPSAPDLKYRIGDWTTEEGRAALLEISPLTYVERIQRPLLISQGANDPRVTKVEADQIVAAMEEKNIPVTYVLYPDEGHGNRIPENSRSLNAVIEAFLAEQLGGRFEPVGSDFEGSSILVPVGAEHVPGLPAALAEAERGRPAPTERETTETAPTEAAPAAAGATEDAAAASG